MTDYTVENHGSIYLVCSHNVEAFQWLREKVEDSAQWFFGIALAVEHRYIADLVTNLREDGFTVD